MLLWCLLLVQQWYVSVLRFWCTSVWNLRDFFGLNWVLLVFLSHHFVWEHTSFYTGVCWTEVVADCAVLCNAASLDSMVCWYWAGGLWTSGIHSPGWIFKRSQSLLSLEKKKKVLEYIALILSIAQSKIALEFVLVSWSF